MKVIRLIEINLEFGTYSGKEGMNIPIKQVTKRLINIIIVLWRIEKLNLQSNKYIIDVATPERNGSTTKFAKLL